MPSLIDIGFGPGGSPAGIVRLGFEAGLVVPVTVLRRVITGTPTASVPPPGALDEFWVKQTIDLTATLTDPLNNDAPTNDPDLEIFSVSHPNGTLTTITPSNPQAGIYLATLWVDQTGWWKVSDGEGGVYVFWVRPSRGT